MDLKEEIALLERKLELLKLVKQAQDQIGQPQPVYVPYPVYPEPYYTSGTAVLKSPWIVPCGVGLIKTKTARSTIHTGSL